MILVTGGAGFIGSNLVRALNARGSDDILLVEDMREGRKALNLSNSRIADYLDQARCLALLEDGSDLSGPIEAVFHLGACADTTEWDGRYMMDANFRFSRALFQFCSRRAIPFVYASSAAIYGRSTDFREVAENENPLNVYGYSKLAFDQFVRHQLPAAQSLVAGLRYFNVYGPREQHKGAMASVVYHLNSQLQETGSVRLFDASHGYAAGEQLRDFVHVDDVVAATLWFADQDVRSSGIFNCGTGSAATFNTVASTIIDWHGRGEIEYIDFPPKLEAAYQAFTQADLSRLRSVGYSGTFRDVDIGTREYLNWLAS